MKKTLYLLLILSITTLSFAQRPAKPQWTGIISDSPATFQTQLVSSTENSVRVNIQVPGFYTTTVVTPRGEADIITVPKAVSTVQAGEPDVPMTGIPVMIGDKAQMKSRVIDAQYMDFEGIEVAPSKGDFSRQIDPATVPYTYGECYDRDAFFPESNLDLYEPYIIRDFRGQNMAVHPFAYNPVTKTLRVYYNMTVELYKVDDNGKNTIESRRRNVVKMDPDFKSVYQHHFINFEEGTAKYTPVDEVGDLLIICNSSFMNAMTDFVNWKKTRGINTTIVKASTAGSTYSAIKTYIQNQYNANNNLTHVLLVGDVAQIPGYSYSGGGSSYSGKGDNPYGQIVGNDIYNDLFIGRFSASSVAQVTNQVQKVIKYERDMATSDNWLKKGLGVSTTESNNGHNYEDDYQHIENLRTDLLNYGYSTVYQDYRNVSGYPTSTTTTISNHINSGVGIINYCNHGTETEWQSHYYSNSHVNALTNSNKLPFIFSVACLNGKYDYAGGDCFAEAWMHATNNSTGAPTGAVGTLMSYISQPWVPPMWAQDEFVDILIESYNNNIKHTWGGSAINAIMAIFDHYSTSNQPALGTYQAWVLYGDPSMMLRTSTPQSMTVTHNGFLNVTQTNYTVNVTNGNGALATLTDEDHNIIGKATVSNGTANISINSSLDDIDQLTLCVFGYNKVTYLGTVSVMVGNPYNITAVPVDHGTVLFSPETAYLGETVYLTALPESGYYLRSWLVYKTDDMSSTVPVNGNQFVMPDHDVSVAALFVASESEVTIGSGSNTSTYLPVRASYNYGLSQQIYTAEELNGTETIVAIAFNNSQNTATRVFDIYLKHTSKTVFSSKSDWVAMTDDDKVFSGAVIYPSSGWFTITLDTPFVYDGNSNLILCVDDNSNSKIEAALDLPKCYIYSTGERRTLRIYNDEIDFSPGDATALATYTGSYYTSNNQIQLIMDSPVVQATQTFTFNSGWNWFSVYLESSFDWLSALKDAIAETNSSAMIKDMSNSTMLQNGSWSDSDLIFGNESMYMVNLSEAVTVTLNAVPASSASHPITLNPGWNWIGFIASSPMALQDAFANIIPNNGDLIKNMSGASSFTGGAWDGSLDDLEPGQGYMYYNNGTATITLIFPVVAK